MTRLVPSSAPSGTRVSQLPTQHGPQSSLPGNFVIMCTDPSVGPLGKLRLLSCRVHQFHHNPFMARRSCNTGQPTFKAKVKRRKKKEEIKLYWSKRIPLRYESMKRKRTHLQKMADGTERRHRGEVAKIPWQLYCDVALFLLFNPPVSKQSYGTNYATTVCTVNPWRKPLS